MDVMLNEDVSFQWRDETIFLCMIVPPPNKTEERKLVADARVGE